VTVLDTLWILCRKGFCIPYFIHTLSLACRNPTVNTGGQAFITYVFRRIICLYCFTIFDSSRLCEVGTLAERKQILKMKFPYVSLHISYVKDTGKCSLQFEGLNMNVNLRGLTDFMELSPSWEAANCVATQELPSILWNPKVHYRVHMSHPLVPILSHIYLVHTTSFYLSEIHFNIIHPPMSLFS
jgi:hypothetical protein